MNRFTLIKIGSICLITIITFSLVCFSGYASKGSPESAKNIIDARRNYCCEESGIFKIISLFDSKGRPVLVEIKVRTYIKIK